MRKVTSTDFISCQLYTIYTRQQLPDRTTRQPIKEHTGKRWLPSFRLRNVRNVGFQSVASVNSKIGVTQPGVFTFRSGASRPRRKKLLLMKWKYFQRSLRKKVITRGILYFKKKKKKRRPIVKNVTNSEKILIFQGKIHVEPQYYQSKMDSYRKNILKKCPMWNMC